VYFPGVVRVVNGDGSFDIEYEDGDREVSVHARLLRWRGKGHGRAPMDVDAGTDSGSSASSSSSSSSSASSSSSSAPSHTIGFNMRISLGFFNADEEVFAARVHDIAAVIQFGDEAWGLNDGEDKRIY
jgi:hypothetical protein